MNNTILVTCMNDGCDNEFRVPEFGFNSTIKNNPNKQECNYCKGLKKLEASKQRKIENKKLLAQSTLYSNKERTPFKKGKYTSKNKGCKKGVKTAHDWFYSSTAWKWFSRYVLTYYSFNGEVAKCCTCGQIHKINSKSLHCGHWLKVFDANSTNFAIAFEFTDCGPQCLSCNSFQGGKQSDMYYWFRAEHGQEELDRLYRLSKKPFKLDALTMEEIANEYKEKFYNLLEERNYKNQWKR